MYIWEKKIRIQFLFISHYSLASTTAPSGKSHSYWRSVFFAWGDMFHRCLTHQTSNCFRGRTRLLQFTDRKGYPPCNCMVYLFHVKWFGIVDDLKINVNQNIVLCFTDSSGQQAENPECIHLLARLCARCKSFAELKSVNQSWSWGIIFSRPLHLWR